MRKSIVSPFVLCFLLVSSFVVTGDALQITIENNAIMVNEPQESVIEEVEAIVNDCLTLLS